MIIIMDLSIVRSADSHNYEAKVTSCFHNDI